MHGAEHAGDPPDGASCTGADDAAMEMCGTGSTTCPEPAGGQPREAADAEATAPKLKRVQFLPIGPLTGDQASRSRLDLLSGELKRMRASNHVIVEGTVVRSSGVDFVATKCEPPSGVLGAETDYYVDGAPVIRFQSVTLAFFAAPGESNEQVSLQFLDYVLNSFPEGPVLMSETCARTRCFFRDQTFRIRNLLLHVKATRPTAAGMGVLTTSTELTFEWDGAPELERVQILPFRGSWPRMPSSEFFRDFLRPYLLRNCHRKYQVGDDLFYGGVDFKVVSAEPAVPARIGPGTRIYCDGSLPFTMEVFLTFAPLETFASLPEGLQRRIFQDASHIGDYEAVFQAMAIIPPDTLQQLLRREVWPLESTDAVDHEVCTVCQEDFATGDEVIILPCRHVFHQKCIAQWLRRIPECPICKDDVERAVEVQLGRNSGASRSGLRRGEVGEEDVERAVERAMERAMEVQLGLPRQQTLHVEQEWLAVD